MIEPVIAAAAESDWNALIEMVTAETINAWELDHPPYNAPLHFAAQNGAPENVVKQLIELGAWRTLRNADGLRPLELAQQNGRSHLVGLLEPVYLHDVPLDMLDQVKAQFHIVIHERVVFLVEEHDLRLPQLQPLLEKPDKAGFFGVPGMYGGFGYWLDLDNDDPALITES